MLCKTCNALFDPTSRFILRSIDEDLQDQAGTSLLDPNGQCTQALINLMVTGQATPYMHNGSLEVQDLQGVCHERFDEHTRARAQKNIEHMTV